MVEVGRWGWLNPDKPIGGQTNLYPVVIKNVAFKRIDLFYKGKNDTHIWHKWWDGIRWNPQGTVDENLGGETDFPPAAVSWGPNRIDLFYQGRPWQTGSLWHKWWDGIRWNPQGTVDENMNVKMLCGTLNQNALSMASNPISWGANRIDFFYIGGNEGDIWQKWYQG